MRRDMELVRTILVKLADHRDAAGPREELVIEGRSSDEVSGHVKLLYQAGLIEATDLSSGGDTLWFPGALTWEGQDFLAAVENEGVWKSTIAKIKEAGGSLPFEVIKELALKIAAKYAGLGD
jgi:uncharacterized protein DUF2513